MSDPHPHDLKQLYDAAAIRLKVRSLGEEIERDHPANAGRDPVLISILGGSVVFLADLIRAIRRPIRYETVKVDYSPNGDLDGVLEIQYPISLDFDGRPAVIVKDVVSTGVPESYLVSQFLDRGAERVSIAALLDIPEERRVDIETDYYAFTPKRAGLFVGYGLKYDGQYGNLPYVGRIQERQP